MKTYNLPFGLYVVTYPFQKITTKFGLELESAPNVGWLLSGGVFKRGFGIGRSVDNQA